jgi:hypothetical protein
VLAPLRSVDSALQCRAFMQRLYEKMVDGESVMFGLRYTMQCPGRTGVWCNGGRLVVGKVRGGAGGLGLSPPDVSKKKLCQKDYIIFFFVLRL